MVYMLSNGPQRHPAAVTGRRLAGRRVLGAAGGGVLVLCDGPPVEYKFIFSHLFCFMHDDVSGSLFLTHTTASLQGKEGGGLLVDDSFIHSSFVSQHVPVPVQLIPNMGCSFHCCLLLVDNFIHKIIKTRHHHVKDIDQLPFYVERFIPRFCLCSRSPCCPQKTTLENDFEYFGFAWRTRQVPTY